MKDALKHGVRCAMVVGGIQSCGQSLAPVAGRVRPRAEARLGLHLILSNQLSDIVDLIGTIRGDFALAVGRNICHGSDAVESAEKEIALYALLFHDRILCTDSFYSWFPEGVVQYTNDNEKWVFE